MIDIEVKGPDCTTFEKIKPCDWFLFQTYPGNYKYVGAMKLDHEYTYSDSGVDVIINAVSARGKLLWVEKDRTVIRTKTTLQISPDWTGQDTEVEGAGEGVIW